MKTQMGRLMVLTSVNPLPDGSHVLEARWPEVWDHAREAGLANEDYGKTWFVYRSLTEYIESLENA